MAKNEMPKLRGGFKIEKGRIVMSNRCREELAGAPPEAQKKVFAMMEAMIEAQKRYLAGEFTDPPTAIQTVMKERGLGEIDITQSTSGPDDLPPDVEALIEEIDADESNHSVLN